jgi:DNA-binding NarL/FixJ family response regulator
MRKQRPAVKIILMSAALDGAGALDPAAVGVDGVLQKPMEPAALLEMVRRVLASDSHD